MAANRSSVVRGRVGINISSISSPVLLKVGEELSVPESNTASRTFNTKTYVSWLLFFYNEIRPI